MHQNKGLVQRHVTPLFCVYTPLPQRLHPAAATTPVRLPSQLDLNTEVTFADSCDENTLYRRLFLTYEQPPRGI